ncbi:serine hydrolase domain-containing protein [uncultured Croceitalea sp.]|uniref:serine hydrolase domain-containing protein n=1 Tax=uncultured Croceitalea sp. TaxID=1798908 RepID=UPI00374F1B5A
MKNTILILSLTVCFACQNCKKKTSASNKEKQTDATISAIDKELDSLYNTGIFNGFTATIVDSTEIVYNKGFGYADVVNKKAYTEHTIINIASVSKLFIGVGLLKAQEMSLLDLDDPINNYLPFKVVHPSYPDEIITIRQLATHTSAIVDTEIYMETAYANKDTITLAENLKRYTTYYQNSPSHWMPLAEYMDKILRQGGEYYTPSVFADRKPGAQYEYSNIGAALCGLIIEYAAKKPFNKFTKEHIFEPLAMLSTAWFFEEVDMTNYSKLYYDELELPYYKILSYPDGGLITSSTDMGKFLTDLIKGYSGNGTILSSPGYEELFKSQLDESAFEKKKNYNVGIFTEKELTYNVIGHTGGDPGTNTMLFFNTKTKKGRIFIANTDSKKENSDAVMWGIWDTIGEFN